MRRLCLSVGALITLITAWFAGEYFTMRRAVPPPGVQTLSAWLAWKPDAELFYLSDDGIRLAACSQGAGLLPSGPSIYIFDQTGALVDMSRDAGDDPVFARKWPVEYSWKVVGRRAAVDWLENKQ